ncbi:MAG: hypothetical protein JWR08_2289, partial [Enterovirga sp.]|nr:hypothetical protein [Enterovirga sp.]
MTSSKASPAWPGFVRCVALAGAAALAAGLAVTLLVDPFWVFRDAPPWLAWTGGVNRHLDLEMRRAKPLQLLSRPADTVLVGSSTVYRGLDPADVAGGTYNLGLSSLMADELPLVARLIVARGDVRSVVIGLDYFSFSAMAGPPPLDPALAGRSGRAAAWLSAALSLRALAGSSPASIRAALEPGSWRRDGFKTTPDYPPAVTRRLLRDQ